MKGKIILGLLAIILLFSGIKAVGAVETYETYEPLVGTDEPEKYYSVYVDPDGTVHTGLTIPILRTEWRMDTLGGIVFSNVTIPRGEVINNATLRLYFRSHLEATTEDVGITVYGYKSPLTTGAHFQGLDWSFPHTSKLVNVNLTGITSEQWVEIDVKDIVREITNQYSWSSGRSLGICIYGLNTDTRRSYQSNVGLKYPQLLVGFGADPFINETQPDPSEPPEWNYLETHGNYTIYNQTYGLIWNGTKVVWSPTIYNRVGGGTFFKLQSYPVAGGTDYTVMIRALNYSEPTNWNLMQSYESLAVQGSYLYGLFDNNNPNTYTVSLARTQDLETWENLVNITTPDSHETSWSRTGAIHWNDALDRWEILFGDVAFEIYHCSYYPGNGTVTTKTEIHDAYVDPPHGLSMYATRSGDLFIGMGAQPSGGTSFKAYLDHLTPQGVWDAATLTDPTLVTTNTLNVHGYYDENTDTEWLVWSWSWIDQSGTSDNSAWIRVQDAETADVDQVGSTYQQLGDPKDQWSQATEGTTYDPDSFIIDADGNIWITGYKDSGGKDSPAISHVYYGDPDDPWTAQRSQADSATPSVDWNYEQVYLNPISGEPGLIAGSWTSGMVMSWIDPLMLNSTYYNETTYNITVSLGSGVHNWLSGAKTPTQWARVTANEYGTEDNFDFTPQNWWVAPRYHGSVTDWLVRDENGTIIDLPCLLTATTLEEVEDCIDAYDPSNIPPDDPSPVTWEDEGAFTRGRMRTYFFIAGLVLIFGSLGVFAMAKGAERFIIFWVMLFCWMVGLALLWQIPAI